MMTEVRFTVSARQLGDYERKVLRLYPKAVKQGVRLAGKDIVIILQRKTVALNIWDRGKMAKGWRATPIGNGLTLKVYNREPHAVYVEFGRSAGAMPPPLAPILAWVRRQLGLSGPDARNVAWAITKTISLRGIAPRPVLTAPSTLRAMSAAMTKNLTQATDAALKEAAS